MFDSQLHRIESAIDYFTKQNNVLVKKGHVSLAQKNNHYLNEIVDCFNAMDQEHEKLQKNYEREAAITSLFDINDYLRSIPTWYMRMFPARHFHDLFYIRENYQRYENSIDDFIMEVRQYRFAKDIKSINNELANKLIYIITQGGHSSVWYANVQKHANSLISENELKILLQTEELPLINDHRIICHD